MKNKHRSLGLMGMLLFALFIHCKDKMVATPESQAENVAKNYFLNLSKTPATIKFQTVQAFDKEGSVFFMHAVFDEQNQSGALVRYAYCFSLDLSVERTDRQIDHLRACPRELNNEQKRLVKVFSTTDFKQLSEEQKRLYWNWSSNNFIIK